jgi:hypothetical protein
MPPDEDATARLSAALVRAVARRDSGDQPDLRTEAEVEGIENQKKQAELHGFTQDIAERKKYAKSFFILSCIWLLLVAVLLLFQGFGLAHFRLGEPVMLAAIGATTVNVLGILYVVANYLFPKK